MLENFKAGEKVSFNEFIFENYDIEETDEIYKRIYGKSYKENPHISLKELEYVKLLHYDYNGEVKVGELIINKVILKEVHNIFEGLFNKKYQINSMRLIDDFWADDSPHNADRNSIVNNNSSCFCYRLINNTNDLSKHALGVAIDINPLENPYTPKRKDGSFDDSLLSDYEKDLLVDRNTKAKSNSHIITLDDVLCQEFAKEGFECGGIWPSRSPLNACDWQHFEPTVEKMKLMDKK